MLFRNVSGTDLILPALNTRVDKGETVEVTGDDAKALGRNAAFERVDEPKPRTRQHDDDAAPADDTTEEQ